MENAQTRVLFFERPLLVRTANAEQLTDRPNPFTLVTTSRDDWFLQKTTNPAKKHVLRSVFSDYRYWKRNTHLDISIRFKGHWNLNREEYRW